MTFEQLSLAQVLELRKENRDDIKVKFYGTDVCDHYALIEDRRSFEQNGHSDTHMLFYVDGESERPTVYHRCENLLEGVLRLSETFMYDNCEVPDTENPGVYARQEKIRQGLASILSL